jgi:hypothetical protein
MNDGRYRAYDPAIFTEFTQGYVHIIEVVKRHCPGCRITLIRPSTYDDVTRSPLFEGGYNAVMIRYGDWLAKIAAERECDVADLNALLVKTLQGANAENPALAQRLLPDRVHPGAGGHLVMAQSLLDAWRAPSLVSSVVLDTNPRNVISTENTNVTDFAVEDTISWNQLDWALPMPLDPNDQALNLAARHSGFAARLNRQMVTLHNLPAGTWQLSIDQKPIEKFSAAALQAGVNLAEYDTPMAGQARRVHELTLRRTRVKNARWREIQVPLESETLDGRLATFREMDGIAMELERAQRAAAQPVERVYKLAKVS